MLITTKQAAEKLHIDLSTVRTLIRKGQLKDYGKRKEGATKHYALLDHKEVSEFAKVYKSRKTSEGTSVAHPATGLLTRLDRIEEKLDQLLAIWA